MARDEVTIHQEPGVSRLAIENRADVGQDAFGAWWQSYLRGTALPDNIGDAPLTIVDLFCGAGGFGAGIDLAARAFGRRAEFRWIVDADAAGMDVYRRTLPVRNVLNASVSSLIDYRVRQRGGETRFAYNPTILHGNLARENGVDMLVAGPPCQGHSNLNNHTRRNDPRNDLYVATVAVAVALGAKAVVIENVPTVTRSHGEVVRIARDLLLQNGYDVDECVLKADELGWAQTRARFFMIATRGPKGTLAGSAKRWAVESRRSCATVDWAISDLGELAGEDLFDTAPRQTPENRRRIDWLFENGEYDLRNSERPICHQDGTTYTAVYGRMRGDRPAPTITTGIGTPGQGRFIHPHKPRLVTPHEAARLQGFSDRHGFIEKGRPQFRKSLAKWIGDAVPPILGMHAGIVALSHIFGQTPDLPWCAADIEG